jgi:hypothetical protein
MKTQKRLSVGIEPLQIAKNSSKIRIPEPLSTEKTETSFKSRIKLRFPANEPATNFESPKIGEKRYRVSANESIPCSK